MFELFRLAIALIGSFSAGAWDLKTTDIPDWLVFLMIALGLFMGGAEGYLTGDWTYFAESAVVIFAFTCFSLVMYYAGSWGAGDGALLIAVGSLLPRWPFASPISFVPFPLAYFVSVFAMGLLFSTSYLALMLVRDRKARRQFSKEFSSMALMYAPIVVLILLFVPLLPPLFSFLLALVLLATPPIYALSNAADRFFYRLIPTKQLKEGDMIGEDIPKLKLFKRQIRGLSEKEVKELRKMKKSVLVRDGVRYGIVFFLALLPLLFLSAGL